MSDDAVSVSEEGLTDELELAFAPIHKRAFGIAVGSVAGMLVFALTAASVLRGGHTEILPLLANYYPGYSVSWTGAVVGFAWTFFVFFVAGWFAAFCRNFALATSIWIGRAKAELEATHDFLDHI